MSTKIQKARETSWAEEAIEAERVKPPERFRYGSDEAARIDAVRHAARNPKSCSREIPVAPARGPVAEFRETVSLPKGDGFQLAEAPYRAGCPGRVRDVFDIMTEQAMRRRGGRAPFTAGQVQIARDYRALFERVQSAGMKCSADLNAVRGGDGGRDFMDVFIADSERLRRLQRAIGAGDALAPRRDGAHNMDRGTRRSITDARLVEMVCVGQEPLSAVLRAHGWALAGKNRKCLHDALCASLERMRCG
ncbi:hypothetical protein [Palleronia caenipelagi]|uniref:Uncharacterized protein n=1 Tax=Palleronia caenipelagi TaxID=2489174 RepID=A0A547Q685_9RHOB|nr:hypothetical protein [Palleronia caenipelagi]TRD21897.1 hypothetical protein FEV53_07560 [Palleronia caenipelagi]